MSGLIDKILQLEHIVEWEGYPGTTYFNIYVNSNNIQYFELKAIWAPFFPILEITHSEQMDKYPGYINTVVCASWHSSATPNHVSQHDHTQTGPINVVVCALYFQAWVEQRKNLF